MNCSKKLAILTAVALTPAINLAHHGLGGRYDRDSTLELEGEVTHILWRNPHIRLSMSVTDESGDAESWAVEGTAPTIIQRFGIAEGMVNEGDRVRVAGFPSSRGINEISIHNLLLSDGRELLLDPRFQARWSDDTVGHEGSFLRVRTGDSSAPELGIFRVWATTIAQPGSYPLFPEAANPELSERYALTDEARARLAAFDPAVFTDPPVIEKFWLWDPELRVQEFNCTESG